MLWYPQRCYGVSTGISQGLHQHHLESHAESTRTVMHACAPWCPPAPCMSCLGRLLQLQGHAQGLPCLRQARLEVGLQTIAEAYVGKLVPG